MSLEYRPLSTPPYSGLGRFAIDTLVCLRKVGPAGADFVLSYASLGVQTVYSIVQGRELSSVPSS